MSMQQRETNHSKERQVLKLQQAEMSRGNKEDELSQVIGFRSARNKRRQVVVVDPFYIALFSTLEQTHCILVACDSK